MKNGRSDMFRTVGIDVGSSSVKSVLMTFDGDVEQLVTTNLNKIRKRDTKEVVRQSYELVLAAERLRHQDIAYVATTGEGEMVDFRRGHFYSMTTHARGALYLNPDVRAVADAGALHARVLVMDQRSKVLAYRMTSQCASGSGQFLENISRYLGIAMEDVGPLSMQADKPEVVSGICAVLAETDVINMVSRGITTGNILKGIHISMGRRLVNLLRALTTSGQVMVTGGLANDTGFVRTLQELADGDSMDIKFHRHDLSVFAGAIGAAIWGGYRHRRLQQPQNITGQKEVSAQ